MRVVCIADTHGFHGDLTMPKGDTLIHAGDFTKSGGVAQLESFVGWLNEQDYKHKVVVAGNHDARLGEYLQFKLDGVATYLRNRKVTIDGIHIYGSPNTPIIRYKHSMCYDREDGYEVWKSVPRNLDILVTHGPPAGILDKNDDDVSCGCRNLAARVTVMHPRYHVFGHIHESYGTASSEWTNYVNCAIWDHVRQEMNQPVVIKV